MLKRKMSLLLVCFLMLVGVAGVSCMSAKTAAEETAGSTGTLTGNGTSTQSENGTGTLSANAAGSGTETIIQLSDSGVTVNGQPASRNPEDAVHIGADIVYYEAGRGPSYGEGTAKDEHSKEEAEKHTVVTITKPGVYRVSGTMSAGQLAIDLGKDAVKDPTAVVALILDGVKITNTVAPGVIFYNVYEPYSADEDPKGVVDLSHAGAQVILADDSVNVVNGSYVARIYQEGTTKKLHKYDGAFYSKMSMNISGEAKGTGELYIKGANEGLNSELHLAINGGKIFIESQDDGINTNEDGISVTSINGGYVYVNGGLGAEGDGIDSNGYLTINGGTIVTMANGRTPDGGIDADKDITINGGTLIALGTRNDAASSASGQPFMELAFASTQSAGTTIVVQDTSGKALLNHKAEKAFQTVTFSSPDLQRHTEYNVFINDKQQQYTGNSFGMRGFGRGPGIGGQGPAAGGQGSTSFIITDTIHSFSGISEAAGTSAKTRVTFTVNNGEGVRSVASGERVVLEKVDASADVPATDIQLTVTDVPSEDFAQTFLLSELNGDFSKLLPEEDGRYLLTIAVVPTNPNYTGASEWEFVIGVLPFEDVGPDHPLYDAVKAVYDRGILVGTSQHQFSPESPVTRAIAITALGRMVGVEPSDTSLFQDVPPGSWYSGYVGWAADIGLVVGDGQGRFMPDAAMTVEHMKLVMAKYLEISGLNLSIDELFPASTAGRAMTRGELAQLLSKLL
jgi:hypothetical protein